MNQILSTSMPKETKKRSNANIGSIIKFFGIAILIFGVLILGVGAYSIYENQSGGKEKDLEPTISFENKTDSTILLKITHQVNIAEVQYRWNLQDTITVNGAGGKYLEKEISIPSGTNTLHVVVVDENGNEISYEKQYELESNINIEVSGNKIKISYDGDNMISYMTYRWDEEDEETIEINDMSFEHEIEALKGLHNLTVVVVDEDNNTDTKSQKVNGVSKPKVTIDVDDSKTHFVINASDDEQLTKIEFRLNQDDAQQYMLNLEDKDLKELEYVLPMELQPGENLLEVTVYNSNGIFEESGVKFVKQ